MLRWRFEEKENEYLVHGVTDILTFRAYFDSDYFYRAADKQVCLRKTHRARERIQSILQEQAEHQEIAQKPYRKRLDAAHEQQNRWINNHSHLFEEADVWKEAAYTRKTVEYKGICPRLMNHQKIGAHLTDLFDRYGFFYDTGTGKTVMALEIISQKKKKTNARFLVVCPKTIVWAAWMADCHEFFPGMRILPLTRTNDENIYDHLLDQWSREDGMPGYEIHIPYRSTKHERIKRKKETLIGWTDHIIINPELLLQNPEYYLHPQSGTRTLDIDGIVFDESALLRTPTAKITKLIAEASKSIKYLYFLSGKPAPNRLAEYYPQMQMILPELLTDSYQSVYEMLHGEFYRSSKRIAPSSMDRGMFLKYINFGSITVSKEDCIDLPEKTYIIRKIELDKNSMFQYSNMQHGLYTRYLDETKSGKGSIEKVQVYHLWASLTKLRQIASGFILNGNKAITLHKHKQKELLAVLDEIGEHQVLIWCQYIYEIETLESVLKSQGKTVVTGYSGTKNKDASITAFKTGAAQYLIAHPRTLQYGVTLTNCNYAVYYSTSYSHEEYYQSHDRIFRKGQVNACTYIMLQAEDTIDEVMYKVIQKKMTMTEQVELILKHLSSKGNTYYSGS